MKILQRLAQVAVALLLLLVVCYIALYLKASSAEEEVERAWAGTFMDLGSLPAQFPPADKNTTALLLEEMFNPGGKLGIKGNDYLMPWKDGWKLLEMDVEDPALISKEAQQYLDAHQTDLLGLYEQIRRQPPQWEQDIEKLSHSPMPNFLRQRAISQMFLLDAMNKSAQGETKEAMQALEAAWATNNSLRSRPEAITQLIAMNIDRVIAKVLLQLRDVPVEWQDRLLEHNYRDSIQITFAHEAWMYLQMARTYPDMMGMLNDSRTTKALTEMSRPYLRMCATNSAEALRQALIEYQKQKENPDNFDRGSVYKKLSDGIADWNIPGKRIMHNPAPLSDYANETMLALKEASKTLRERSRKPQE